jgi:opacity protein-like surface antigen
LSLTKFFQRSRPYVGSGLGAAEVFADFDAPTTTNNNQGSGRDTVFTYYVKAGVRFPLTDRTELGVQYRFSGNTGFTIKQTKSEEIFAHTVSVALRIQF